MINNRKFDLNGTVWIHIRITRAYNSKYCVFFGTFSYLTIVMQECRLFISQLELYMK